MRLTFLIAAALIAGPALAATRHAPARQAATADWLNTVVRTPEGGYRLGNPDAKVKIVEYGSLTCPHCRAFEQSAMTPLRANYIATGKVSFEYRNFVRNGPDYVAALLAGCDGPAKFFDRIDTLFSTQDVWIKPFVDMTAETSEKIGTLPQDQQIAALGKAGGLDTFMRTRGVTPTRIDQCLGDKAAQDALTATRNVAVDTYKIDGTPGFLINGTRQTKDFIGRVGGIVLWEDLEPRIVAALR